MKADLILVIVYTSYKTTSSGKMNATSLGNIIASYERRYTDFERQFR